MLPGTDGLALCRWIRTDSALPVIMVTARGEAADRIVGLELGADDYVTKPFSPRELAIRVRNVLKRADSPPSAAAARTMSFDALTIDGKAREVRLDGQLVRLTGKEFDLLFFLASQPARGVLAQAANGSRLGLRSRPRHRNGHRSHRRLRSKIERDPSAATPPRDTVGRRLQVRAVIHLALAVAAADPRRRGARRVRAAAAHDSSLPACSVRAARRPAAARCRVAVGLGHVPHGRRREDPRRRRRRSRKRGRRRARAGRIDHAVASRS